MSNVLLKISDLTKQYPESKYQFGPMNLEIHLNHTVAFLGKNGAGKTTFFQMITGNQDPTSGSILLNGQKLTPDSHVLKRQIGYLPQNLHLPKWVSGSEILSYAASLYGIKAPKSKIGDAMDFWDCTAYADKPIAACSHGMQKRVALALATLHDPDLLVLDEPFSGLDLFHIKALTDTILMRSKKGQTTIISTHIAPYTASLCHKVYLIQEGKCSPLSDWEKMEYIPRIQAIESAFFPGSQA